MIRVTVWNEYEHERNEERVAKVYPKGIHGAIADFLGTEEDIEVRTATLDQPENGLTQEVLDNTDVLVWWGHMAHHKVLDEVAMRVKNRVLDGMGFIALHSAHASKPFRLLMGTHTETLRWRENDELQRYWVVAPGHPIVAGLGEYFEIPMDEILRRILRHTPARPSGIHFVGAGRRGVPLGLLLAQGRGPHILLPGRPRDLPGILPEGSAAGNQERDPLGRAAQVRGGAEHRAPLQGHAQRAGGYLSDLIK